MTVLATPIRNHENPYARAVRASKSVRWEIERDVIRGRQLEREHKYLPDGLSLVTKLGFLSADERRFVSQIQGRTYANMFGLVERFINAKVLELSRDYLFDDQVALEGLIRFSDEELKHQELFRQVEQLAGHDMPAGYRFVPEPNEVARVVLAKSTWAVLALTCHIELFSLAHYKQSIEPDAQLSPLWKDVFLFHWREESQHALLDEYEWRREDRRVDHSARNRGVDDLIALIGAVDGIVQAQSAADAEYFLGQSTRQFAAPEQAAIRTTFLAAYRFQYLWSGLAMTRFPNVLFELVDAAQRTRIEAALATLA
jgi:hypothetical protein